MREYLGPVNAALVQTDLEPTYFLTRGIKAQTPPGKDQDSHSARSHERPVKSMIGFFLMMALTLLLPLRSASAQDLSGSFTANSSGENFNVDGNGDGTASIQGSDGRYVGEAQDNGDGTWDIQSPSGRDLGQIQDNGDGSFDVSGSQGGDWGSSNSD